MLALAVAHCRISHPYWFQRGSMVASNACPIVIRAEYCRAPRGAGPLCSRASRLQSRRSHRAFGHAGERRRLFFTLTLTLTLSNPNR
jgi:hypothetical protein